MQETNNQCDQVLLTGISELKDFRESNLLHVPSSSAGAHVQQAAEDRGRIGGGPGEGLQSVVLTHIIPRDLQETEAMLGS